MYIFCLLLKYYPYVKTLKMDLKYSLELCPSFQCGYAETIFFFYFLLLVLNCLVKFGLMVVPSLLEVLGSKLRPFMNSSNNVIMVFITSKLQLILTKIPRSDASL